MNEIDLLKAEIERLHLLLRDEIIKGKHRKYKIKELEVELDKVKNNIASDKKIV
jgi:hypothetical protein